MYVVCELHNILSILTNIKTVCQLHDALYVNFFDNL